MKSLIVNVDDVGLSDAINEAVKACYRRGAITGVSVMPCGARFTEAANMLRNLGKVEVGVHLTLAGRFSPCTEDISAISTLLRANGEFSRDYKSFGTRYFLRRIKSHQVYLELANQIKRVMAEGLTITHLDSHEHIHMFPEIFRITLRLAAEFGIPYIRIPLEHIKMIRKKLPPKDLLRHAALRMFTSGAKKIISRTRLKCNDAFLGHTHAGRIDDDILCFMVDNLEDGICELAVHPGIQSPELVEESPWHRNAPAELDTLLNGRWRAHAESRNVRLVSHKEAVSAD